MSTRKIVVLSAGLGQPSSTRLLADRLAEASARALLDQGSPAEFRVVELRDHAHDVTDAMLTGFPSEALADVLAAVGAADGVVAVTPVFTGSYSGLFKSFFDVLDNTALTGTPVLIGATAGTARHSLVLDHELRPLFSYLRAVVVPTGVFAAAEDWGAGDATTTGLPERVTRAADEFAALVSLRHTERRDPFADVVSFEDQLGRLGVQDDV
ncbi:NADPH-dependent FMN reductase [Frigoribacterium sp. ACAM 257]|uniref:FMN reductase n=1 Tax=Frigoribacterium sp. ACAM 257 TaxID=2508998 RepID=UPI0011B9C31B|nr:FMN reductase [Frigoribacterium sp. ACAM 257]TWX40588.1 NADPH-dependent FMN reductase [Frigoribacterium sp. ACAM 257]